MMHEWAHCHDEASNHQLPITVAFWIIWIVSAEEYSSLMQNLMQIHCSTGSVIVNATARQHTSSLKGHLQSSPISTGTVESLFTHAHFSTLSLAVRYINIMQMVLITLTMVGLFWTDLIHIYIISVVSISCGHIVMHLTTAFFRVIYSDYVCS